MATKGKTVKGNAKNNVLKGAAGNDKLYGYAGNDKLYGYAGNDYLDGGKGNDVLYGGAGNDTYVYRDGDGVDTVSGYEAGKDILHIAKGALKSVTIAGNKKDLLFNVGKGRVTLKGMAGKTITLKNVSGGIYTMTKTALTAKKGFAGVMDAAAHLSTITTVNASVATKAATLYGNARANTITGGASNDKLYGRAGNDVLKGGNGSDYLDGGVGNDKLYGGVGNDVFVYRDGDGVDTVCDFEASRDALYIAKGALKSTAVASNKKDLVFSVGKGKVTLKGVAGKTITLKNASGGAYTMTKTTLTAKDGFVGTLDARGHFSTITKINADNASKATTLYGNANNNVIIGGSGKDTIVGGKGNDTLTGGRSDNTYVYADGDGKDLITDFYPSDCLDIRNATLKTTTFANGEKDLVFTFNDGGKVTMRHDSAWSFVYGAVLLRNQGGYYTMSDGTLAAQKGFGGVLDARQYLSTIEKVRSDSTDKATTLYGNAMDNWMWAGNNADTMYGGAGHDHIYGEEGDDLIDGESGDDALYGGDGNDSLYGGIGDDDLYGRAGVDYLYGGAGNDSLSGDDGDDFLYGGDGADYLDGECRDGTGYGDDFLSGGAGNDSLLGGKGNDYLDGGTDDDVLEGNSGSDTLHGGAGNDTLHAVDWYYHTASGNKYLYGDAGNDKLYGSHGIDYLSGGTGNDDLEGYDGDDTLAGGAGNDTMWGGYGDDLFVHEGGNDVIKDYNSVAGERDVLYFANSTVRTETKYGDSDLLLTMQDNSTILLKGAWGKGYEVSSTASVQLASLVSVTKQSSLGNLANSSLPSASASGSSLIVANAGTSNVLTKKS